MRYMLVLAAILIGNAAFSVPCTKPNSKPGFEAASKKLLSDLGDVLQRVQDGTYKPAPGFSTANLQKGLARANTEFCPADSLDCSSCHYYLDTLWKNLPKEYKVPGFNKAMSETTKASGQAQRGALKEKEETSGSKSPKLGTRGVGDKEARCLAIEKACEKMPDPKKDPKCAKYGPIGHYYMNCLKDPRS